MAADPAGLDRPVPTVVVVGSASRDLTPDDRRGWRLGGGVTYGSLALARLGIRTAALIGLDHEAMEADELELLRSAGVDVVPVPLVRGPVFVNEERPEGRVQTAVQVSDPVSAAALPIAWRAAAGWLLAPVADEVPEDWARIPPLGATVALGWQGLLRDLRAGEPVHRRPPWASELLKRASVVGVSLHDLPPEYRIDQAASWLGPQTELLFSAGKRGGILLRMPAGPGGVIRYPAVDARATTDATGAGDVALAALLAARIAGGGARAGKAADWVASRRRHLLFAAAAASLTVEQHGLLGVPDLAAVRERLSARHAPAQAD